MHQRKFEEAAAIVSTVLLKSPSNVEALIILADAFEGLKRFDRVIEITTQIASIAADEYERLRAIEQRAWAFLAIGMKSDAERDALTLESSGPLAAKWAKRLRKKIY